MKVLYDYSIFLNQARGGVSRVFNELIPRMIRCERVDCHVFAGFHKNAELARLSKEFPDRIHGWHLPAKWAKWQIFHPVNAVLLAAFAQKFQPDICHYTFYETTRLPTRTKTVITVHDLVYEHFTPHARQIGLRIQALKRVDAIACISQYTREDLLRFYPETSALPMAVIYHGNSLCAPSSTVPPMHTGPYFLYVGGRWGYKNFSLVLEAFGKADFLKPFSLVCFGGAPFSPKEIADIARQGLTERVVWVAGDDTALGVCYRDAAALIYPSKMEGFGLPPLEAMGGGCPVLASSGPPMPEIIGDAGLFFDPLSVDELLAAMHRLLHEPGCREMLVARGRERVGAFSWDKAAREYCDFYESLL